MRSSHPIATRGKLKSRTVLLASAFERETELRGQLEEQYEAKRTDWAERLEIEFQSRETATRKAIMAELDGQLRNERLTFETDLDLLKEETALELEVDMEERLAAFRTRKEEIAVQLERQLDKREEIMRNKALIDVRKREASIRAEIEAQLGLKRAEVRDRLNSLAEKMDSFREMAESKMRDAITSQIQGEIDSSEVSNSRVGNKSLLTCNRPILVQRSVRSGCNPSPVKHLLRCRWARIIHTRCTHLLSGMTRTLGGNMEGQGMGLAGMRAPMGGAKPLVRAPTLRPVKAPIGSAQPAALPKPIERQVRMPIQPQTQVPVVQPTQELPLRRIVVPVGAVEVSITPGMMANSEPTMMRPESPSET